MKTRDREHPFVRFKPAWQSRRQIVTAIFGPEAQAGGMDAPRMNEVPPPDGSPMPEDGTETRRAYAHENEYGQAIAAYKATLYSGRPRTLVVWSVAPEPGAERDSVWRAIRQDLTDQGFADTRILVEAQAPRFGVWGHKLLFGPGDVVDEKPISKGDVLEALESSQTVAL